jgi:hypothetical protein
MQEKSVENFLTWIFEWPFDVKHMEWAHNEKCFQWVQKKKAFKKLRNLNTNAVLTS